MYAITAKTGGVQTGVDGVTGKQVKIMPIVKAKVLSGNGMSRLRVHIGRGFKRCGSCGEINAQRSILCRNPNCELRKQMLLMHRSFDPVQLITYTGADLYSVRSKEREQYPRNFVQITDVTLALERGSAIVSRNAICFVDTCKYDASDVTNLSCKHVKACTEEDKPPVRAEVYPVSHEVLWNLNIEPEQKMKLWDMYKEDEQLVPAVQRLNASSFVVRCAKSKNFPAGRLHVQAFANQPQTAKKTKHACACKKLKIIVEPDNTVVMQEEICDHLLLVLAAVLSKPNGKTIYGNFTNALKSFWIPSSLDMPLSDATQGDALFDFSINIGGTTSMGGSTAADDIFIFGNDFLPNDDIPDFPDNILKSVVSLPESSQSIFNDVSSSMPNTIFHPGDPNLVSSCSIIEDNDIEFNAIQNAATVATADPLANGGCATHMELSDCNIELMDQFQQLTDQIDLCSDDITLPAVSSDLFQADSISIMHPDTSIAMEPNNNFMSSSFSSMNIDVKPCFQTLQEPTLQDAYEPPINYNSNSLLKSNNVNSNNNSNKSNNNNSSNNSNNSNNSSNSNNSNNNMQAEVRFQQLHPPAITAAASLPPIEMPTIAMIKREPISDYNDNNSQNNNMQIAVQFQQLQPPATTIAASLPPIEMPTIAVVKKEPIKSSEIVNEVKTRKCPYIPAKRPLIINELDMAKKAQIVRVQNGPALGYSAWLDYVIEMLNDSVVFDTDSLVKHTFHIHEEIFAHFSKSFSVGIKRRMPNSSCMVKTGKHKGLIKYTWMFNTASTVERIFTTKNISIELQRIFEKTYEGYVPYVQRKPCDAGEKYRRIYPKLSLYVAHIFFDCSNENHKTGLKIEWIPNAFPKSHFGILNIEFSLGYKLPTNI